ncbi:SDR family oxidoreductase [Streptomyces oceani]|uniref:NAD(P)-binding domain-containing protein n=1 Tax=Streptomyces oceani TaxID=1075402 RepID=A0A1E7KGE9_9ACTN|nr:NAD(P)H-binding protein [Streptomyces oceani]OEV02991.1 hypothetical protein AN216_13535 [Streptomyces oceani]
MILATGASGNVGTPLLSQLAARQAPVRAVTRHASRTARSAPQAEAVEADLRRPATLAPALDGVRSLFLLLPADGDLPGILDLARESGVRHVVYVSSLLAQTHPNSPMGRGPLEGERAVRDSGLDWTILRPWAYASNAVWWAPAIREHGVVRAGAAKASSPVIHPADIASVAAEALLDERHRGRLYPLTGPEEITPVGQVRAIGAALGRDLRFEELSGEEHLTQLRQYMPEEMAIEMAGGGDSDGPGVLHTVREVTGTPARTFAQWAREHVELFR